VGFDGLRSVQLAESLVRITAPPGGSSVRGYFFINCPRISPEG